MEKLIEMKMKNGIELTDRELAVRWWNRLSAEEKQNILNEYLPKHTIDSMTYENMYWLWLKQQTLP